MSRSNNVQILALTGLSVGIGMVMATNDTAKMVPLNLSASYGYRISKDVTPQVAEPEGYYVNLNQKLVDKSSFRQAIITEKIVNPLPKNIDPLYIES